MLDYKNDEGVLEKNLPKPSVLKWRVFKKRLKTKCFNKTERLNLERLND